YQCSLGKSKFFCKTCCSPIFIAKSQSPQRYRLRLGALTCDIRERPISHNFIPSISIWEALDAQLRRYEGHEPG
ncbi:aldehyde-activating protein, partial [Pseudoalteromonas sp. S1612]